MVSRQNLADDFGISTRRAGLERRTGPSVESAYADFARWPRSLETLGAGVFHSFAELTAGKMALFISHRFSTARSADRIIDLENGKIAEEGSPHQLASLGGRYAEMFKMQSSDDC